MGDEQAPPLKPQDTIILLLGELSGKMSSLQTSVDNNSAAQAAINRQNEAEHEKFRTKDADLDKRVAVLEDNRSSQRYTKTERTQQWMMWLGIPSALVTAITALFIHK